MTADRRGMRSDYMHWAKTQQRVTYPLSSSEVPGFRMDSLGLSLDELEMDGASHPRYAPLIDRIARKSGVPRECVVTADGTSMANFLAMAALVAPGDEVLIERPTYEPILAAATFLGAIVRRFDRRAEDGFAIDPAAVEARLTAATRLIVITNLHNPSSSLAHEKSLRAIGELAAARCARVLVDEVYLDAAASPQPTAAQLGPQFVCTNSLTKVYGLSGLRCGWILAEPDLGERMWRLNDLFGVNQAHQAERLACIAFDRLGDVLGDTRQRLGRNRALFNRFVSARDDLECMPAEHGIVAFPRWTGGETDRLDALLRSRFDTSIVSGRWFERPDHFRIGLGGATEVVKEGLARIGAALDELG